MNYSERTARDQQALRELEANSLEALKTFDIPALVAIDGSHPFAAGEFVNAAFTQALSGPLEGIIEHIDIQLEFMLQAFLGENERLKANGQSSQLLRVAGPMLKNIQAQLFAAQKLAETEARALDHLRRIVEEAKS